MLSIKNLRASVEDKEILKGLNLEVKAGEVHAIMGPNGAGKTTLVSQIIGLAKPESGNITINGFLPFLGSKYEKYSFIVCEFKKINMEQK